MTQSCATRYHAGIEAERAVARSYLRDGCKFVAHRFRGSAGEIDLIMRRGPQVIFIEVKKSRSHARAAEALSDTQIGRIFDTASEYLGDTEAGLDTDARFDVALVNEIGEIEVLENALAA